MQPRIKAPKPSLLPGRVEPEAKEIGLTNRKPVLTLPAGCAGAGGEGEAGRTQAEACEVGPAPSAPRAEPSALTQTWRGTAGEAVGWKG